MFRENTSRIGVSMQQVKKWLPIFLTGAAGVFLVLVLGRSLFLFLNYMHTLIVFPFNVDYGEGPVLDQVMRLAHFKSIYRNDIASFPFTVSNYPPLYHLVQLPFAWIFGPATWYGRLINLLSILAASLLIGLTIHTLTRDLLAALVGGLLLPAIPYILQWSGFIRVDSLALAVSWAGLYAVVRWPQQRKGLIAAALCLTGAIYTRQSYGLAAPFAAFVWLLSSKPRRRAFMLALWTGSLSIGLFILLNLLTRGGFFINVITANVNPFFWGTVRNYAQGLWDNMTWLVIAAGIYVLGAAWASHKGWWLAAPYLLASTASAVTVGKEGSNVNYLFELSAALSLSAGLCLAWLGQGWESAGWRRLHWVGRRWLLAAGVMVILANQVGVLYGWSLNEYYTWPVERATIYSSEVAQMAQLVADADGPVLADEFMGLIPLSGKALVFQPFEFKQLAAGGLWDETPFIDAVFEQKFALVLLYDPPAWDSQAARWTLSQLEAIKSNYQLTGRLVNTQIYVPSNLAQLVR